MELPLYLTLDTNDGMPWLCVWRCFAMGLTEDAAVAVAGRCENIARCLACGTNERNMSKVGHAGPPLAFCGRAQLNAEGMRTARHTYREHTNRHAGTRQLARTRLHAG